jgi:hypothetical protein
MLLLQLLQESEHARKVGSESPLNLGFVCQMLTRRRPDRWSILHTRSARIPTQHATT